MYPPGVANNEVRIIGGRWKGRKLKFPPRGDLRPTLGRVRETLFNWLAPRIHDTRCLDLFAGSGALGFEALSRGAAEVTFVERDRKVAAALNANAAALDAGAAAVIRISPARSFLSRDRTRFDIVFFDPPFDDDRALALLPDLLAAHLAPDGVVYVELASRTPLPDVGRRIRSARAGDCQFALLVNA